MNQDSKKSTWNHTPEIPIEVSPLFSWPPQPIAWLRWISRYWLVISPITLELLAAFIIYQWFQPSWETMRSLSFDWAILIWTRNLILLTIFAGGLHLWFITFTAQGKNLKFDARDQNRKNGIFTFRNQIWDNVFWSYASGVSAWTIWEILYFWVAANGYAPKISFSGNPVWFIIWFALIPIWSSFHFYWIHRFLHWPPLYRLAHNIHHRNINVGPWAGISMHPIETIIYFSSIIIHLVVPSHPLHILFHFYINGINSSFAHSGFEGIQVKNKKHLNTGDFFHQLHHRYFECNYGTAEMPWDKLFGSFHDGSEKATEATKLRRSKMYSKTSS